MATDHRQPIWTRTYIELNLAQFLVYASNGLLIPALPLYVTDLGGSPFLVGLVLLAFSLPTFTVRPLVGYWADAWSAVGVMTLGMLFVGLGSALYLLPFITIVFVANAVRGIAWAGVNTGGYSLLAHIAPRARRGEASGYYSSIQSSAYVLFPTLALWLIDAPFSGFAPVFVLAAVFGLLAAALSRAIPQPIIEGAARSGLPAGEKQHWLRASTYIDRGVLLATVLLLCLSLTHPTTSSFLPLYARERGIQHVGLFYLIGGATGLLARPLLGRVSDRVGRGRSLVAGSLSNLVGFALLLAAPNLLVLVIAGMFYAAGSSVITAGTTALAIDRADPRRPGVAMATFSIAFSIGQGLGGLLAGAVVELAGYSAIYLGAMALVVVGLLLTLMTWSTLGQRPQAAPATATPAFAHPQPSTDDASGA